MLAGAVYNPLLLMDPAPVAGLSVHVTAVLLDPTTVAVNCVVWFAVRLAVVGLTLTETDCEGTTETVKLADTWMASP